MLTIRPQQMRAFTKALIESWILEHLAEFFPDEIAGLDSATILGRVRTAMEHADRYGFVTDSQVCRYVDLTFILGPGFVQDPSLPWAAEIIADQRLTDPEMRMELLFGAARDHVTRMELIEASQEVPVG